MVCTSWSGRQVAVLGSHAYGVDDQFGVVVEEWYDGLEQVGGPVGAEAEFAVGPSVSVSG